MPIRYRPLPDAARLIAAATSALVTLATFVAVTAGLSGGDASERWITARRASTDAVQRVLTVHDHGRGNDATSTTGMRSCPSS